MTPLPLIQMYLRQIRFALIAALVSSFLVAWSDALFAQGGPASVVVAAVMEEEVASQQAFVANVKPWRESTIGSAVDGRVLEYLVNAGDAVSEGQPLAQLRTATIGIEIAGAEAELALREAELAELKNGSRVEEIALAEALRDVAKANNEYAKAKLERAKRLFNEASGISVDEFESDQAAALVAAATMAQTESSYRLVVEGPRQEQIDQAAARVEMQVQKIASLNDRRNKYTLRSPYSGFVSRELTEAGAWVSQGNPVAQIIEIDPVEIEVYVPEGSIRFVHPGDDVIVSVEAVPDQTFAGTIDQIVPLADPLARTFPVRVRVANPAVESRHPLMPGMLARVTLPTSERQTRLLVPKDAIQLGGSTPTLYRVVDGKATLTPVITGPSRGSWVAVHSQVPGQLNPGDLVVTRGNERLRPGQAVVITNKQDAAPQ
ncbi:efflux RND transporter periplasmic adaptor subunit [Novipirellula galeiformis]|uniref:efflux RND transporter periplasmic adaptor subunit n=1 Tax=Novipirellula galeiformis TaxID=2528004 RepID=UPI0018CEE23A|nr:efflux RND transporter periplasmic adaptor subunit [Novipirellula galeiformis]